MKTSWLVLAAILALAGTATKVKKKRNLTRSSDRLYYPGSYSVVMSSEQEIIFNLTDVLTMPALESSTLLEPRSDLRPKREAVALRRARMRAGTRPICRGCYSGLMIVAPPGQDSKNASWNESSSESEGRSSEGD